MCQFLVTTNFRSKAFVAQEQTVSVEQRMMSNYSSSVTDVSARGKQIGSRSKTLLLPDVFYSLFQEFYPSVDWKWKQPCNDLVCAPSFTCHKIPFLTEVNHKIAENRDSYYFPRYEDHNQNSQTSKTSSKHINSALKCNLSTLANIVLRRISI